MNTNERTNKNSLYRKFILMFFIFIAIAIIVSVLSIYFVMKKLYNDRYTELLQDINSSFVTQINDDIDEFVFLQEYFKENKDKLEIPFEYPDNADEAWVEFSRAFTSKYPGKVYPADIGFNELDEETKLLFARYKYLYWINIFDKIKKDYGLDYAYYIYPIEEEGYMCYMFDGPREETVVDGKSLLLLGYEAFEDRDKHKNMWIAYETGKDSGKMDVYDNEYGHVYTYTTPVIYNDEVLGLVLTDVSFNYISSEIFGAVSGLAIVLIIILGIFSVLMLNQVRYLIISRILKLQLLVNQYSATKDVEIADLLTKDSAHNDEISALSERFSEMIRKLKDYMDDLQAVTAEKERIGAELNIATEIQASMLPRLFPAFPDRKEFTLYATMDPAKEVGGDFYDFFMIDESHIALVMADVSGKGVPAALFMAISKALIKDNAQLKNDPAEVLRNVNEQLCESNGADLFVTVWLGIVDISSGRVTFCDAGHEYPVLLHCDGSHELIKPAKKKMPVGTLEGIQYINSETAMKPGDTIFLYTDGVPEATNSKNELYGMNRVESFFENNAIDNPEDLLALIKKDVNEFVGDAPQFDDMTMLGFRLIKYYERSDK
ncbi:MAG: PP2C family protein-serine/threonine phosphatase [Lachnospiraceae bacterium]|nr:PP2C family protein-serine/threonine phosphatase [Lachnospiraceae bacterium]